MSNEQWIGLLIASTAYFLAGRWLARKWVDHRDEASRQAEEEAHAAGLRSPWTIQ